MSKILPQETHLMFVGISMWTYLLPWWWLIIMIDDLPESWRWMKDPGLHGLQTCGWFMVGWAENMGSKHRWMAVLHKPVIRLSVTYTFCAAMCEISPCALTPDFKGSRLHWYSSLICVSICSWGHKFHRILYKWRLMLDWQAVEYFL